MMSDSSTTCTTDKSAGIVVQSCSRSLGRAMMMMMMILLMLMASFLLLQKNQRLPSFEASTFRTTTTKSKKNTSNTRDDNNNNDSADHHQAQQHHQQLPDTTVIIVTNLIPTSPSVSMITDTIQSVHRHIKGLSSLTPIVIALDGVKRPIHRRDLGIYREKLQRHEEYWKNLEHLKKKNNNASYNLVVLGNNESQGLTLNVWKAINYSTTEFIYLLQHDLMFIQDIQHDALAQTMRDYPDLLRVVRFNLRPNSNIRADGGNCFGDNSTPLSPEPVHGIYFTKSGGWSDNNQFATRAYYQHMMEVDLRNHWSQVMEARMPGIVKQNCTYLSQWLYGRQDIDGPYIYHLDGKRSQYYNSTTITPANNNAPLKKD